MKHRILPATLVVVLFATLVIVLFGTLSVGRVPTVQLEMTTHAQMLERREISLGVRTEA